MATAVNTKSIHRNIKVSDAVKGYVQVYTGSGVDNTMAALGLALRAAGAGLHVFIGQFVHSGRISDVEALKRWADYITVERFGGKSLIADQPSDTDIEAALRGLERIGTVLSTSTYQLVILADANVALDLGLFSVDDLLNVIKMRPDDTEVVITGRNARPEIIAQADLMTEMKAI